MYINSKFTFQIDIETKFLYTFIYIFFFVYFPGWLVILLTKFDFSKALLLWNGNLTSNGSHGPSWPITAIFLAKQILKTAHLKHLKLKHIRNYLLFISY